MDIADLIGSRSPLPRKGLNWKSYGELPLLDTDISFVSSGRPSIDRVFHYDHMKEIEHRTPSRLSHISERDMINPSFEPLYFGRKSVDIASPPPESLAFSSESDQDRLSDELQSTVRTSRCSQFIDLNGIIDTRNWKN